MTLNKKRIIISLLTIVFLLFAFSIKVYAYTDQRVFDIANLFTEQEEQDLAKRCDEIKDKYGITVFITTTENNPPINNSTDPTRDYIELFGEHNIGNSYIGLAIDIDNRGYCMDVFGTDMFEIYTDSVQIDIENAFVDYLYEEDWYGAADAFLDGVVDPVSNTEEYVMGLGGSALIALIISAILTFAKKRQHKEKKIATTAQDYINHENVTLSVKDDRFIKTYTTKTARQTSSSSGGSSGGSRTSTHRSSSGSSHSGRSGRF